MWRERREWMRTREVDSDTVRFREREAGRGQILREGCTWTSRGVIAWAIRRSVRGRINQVDVIVDGRIWRTGAMQHAEQALRTGRWPARKRP